MHKCNWVLFRQERHKPDNTTEQDKYVAPWCWKESGRSIFTSGRVTPNGMHHSQFIPPIKQTKPAACRKIEPVSNADCVYRVLFLVHLVCVRIIPSATQVYCLNATEAPESLYFACAVLLRQRFVNLFSPCSSWCKSMQSHAPPWTALSKLYTRCFYVASIICAATQSLFEKNIQLVWEHGLVGVAVAKGSENILFWFHSQLIFKLCRCHRRRVTVVWLKT